MLHFTIYSLFCFTLPKNSLKKTVFLTHHDRLASRNTPMTWSVWTATWKASTARRRPWHRPFGGPLVEGCWRLEIPRFHMLKKHHIEFQHHFCICCGRWHFLTQFWEWLVPSHCLVLFFRYEEGTAFLQSREGVWSSRNLKTLPQTSSESFVPKINLTPFEAAKPLRAILAKHSEKMSEEDRDTMEADTLTLFKLVVFGQLINSENWL